jgi:hypothetical protein
VFQRYLDRTEGAVMVLVPQGWLAEGGIDRVNPLASGPGQAIYTDDHRWDPNADPHLHPVGFKRSPQQPR